VTLPVRLRSAAEEDLVDNARYLQEQNSELAVRFLEAFDSAANVLGRSPAIGGVCSFQNPIFAEVRAWPVPGFNKHLIFYRILADEIEVIRVIHGARDLKSIFGA
jgi:toxin ParE1/3/4